VRAAQNRHHVHIVKLTSTETKVAQSKKINWLHLSTLIAVAILVGTEMVGASWAAGWALGGLLQLDPLISHALEGVFALCGVVLLFYFMRTALRNEPIRE
jgi:membrane protein implicated in regulation of membrane protease activity